MKRISTRHVLAQESQKGDVQTGDSVAIGLQKYVFIRPENPPVHWIVKDVMGREWPVRYDDGVDHWVIEQEKPAQRQRGVLPNATN